MKVEIKIDPEILEMMATIHAPKMTPQVLTLAEILEEAAGEGKSATSLLIAKNDDKMFVIEPEQVDIIRAEGGEIRLYNKKAEGFAISKSLHEISEMLGRNFVRISKSAIVNINRVSHLSNSFNGTMHIVMKNGITDYISRKYLGDFKKRLGM